MDSELHGIPVDEKGFKIQWRSLLKFLSLVDIKLNRVARITSRFYNLPMPQDFGEFNERKLNSGLDATSLQLRSKETVVNY